MDCRDFYFASVQLINNTMKLIKSNKFGKISLYYNGIYYFPNDIKPSDKREGNQFEIQVVFFSGKWLQDTFYITKEFKEFLNSHL
jgi:hypothetical protein